mmetsp:Transcript_6899/g.12206  ORF Transcript_6899/g.12206 Transcript_6899/m.12206 type:complete len:408 (+) Transcript_6899:42-1265(+)
MRGLSTKTVLTTFTACSLLAGATPWTEGWFGQQTVEGEQASSATAPCPGCVPVFYHGLNGSKCYRIPMLLRTSKGTLLAVAENRITTCDDVGSEHDLVLRRSTDNGKTWGDLIVIYRGNSADIHCPSGSRLCRIPASSNPNLVEVDFHNGSSAILMHFDSLVRPNMTDHGFIMQTWSHDDGETWGTASKIDLGHTMPNLGQMPGPAQGLQGASGKIYFSTRGVRQQNVTNFLYWSSDFGKTWEASKKDLPPEFGNEASLAFLVSAEDERILMNIRTSEYRRAQVIWGLDHLPGEVFWPDGMVDATCQGSIVNDAGVLFLSNAAYHNRSHMTVKSSHDHGQTWSEGLLVWHGPSAYSQLAPLGGGKLGLLFEAGNENSANPYQTISFVQVDEGEVPGKEARLPPLVIA